MPMTSRWHGVAFCPATLRVTALRVSKWRRASAYRPSISGVGSARARRRNRVQLGNSLPPAKCRDCGGNNRTAPGIVISRHATGSGLERRLISPSSSLICGSSAVKVSISSLRTNRALSGYEEFGSST
jgi:hypothetical protein